MSAYCYVIQCNDGTPQAVCDKAPNCHQWENSSVPKTTDMLNDRRFNGATYPEGFELRTKGDVTCDTCMNKGGDFYRICFRNGPEKAHCVFNTSCCPQYRPR